MGLYCLSVTNGAILWQKDLVVGSDWVVTPILSTATQSILLNYAGTVKVLDCPNLAKSFEREKDWLAR